MQKFKEICPVHHFTVGQAHKEFNSLMDKISAKFEQLDSGELVAVNTQMLNVKSAKLAILFTCMSQMCQWLNLPIPAHLHRPPFFKHWRTYFWSKFLWQAAKLSGWLVVEECVFVACIVL